jgi:hypothetical protein
MQNQSTFIHDGKSTYQSRETLKVAIQYSIQSIMFFGLPTIFSLINAHVITNNAIIKKLNLKLDLILNEVC